MENNSLGDVLAYTATLFGGLFGMAIGFVFMAAILVLMIWPLYGRWKHNRR